MGIAKYRINLPQEERDILIKLSQKDSEKQSVVRRTKIILMSEEGIQNQKISEKLGVNVHVVSTWMGKF